MSVKLSLFTRLTVKLESPYAFTFLFNKPTALELLTIGSQTAQLYSAYNNGEDKVTPTIAVYDYQTGILKQYCTEVHGLEDDNGIPTVLKTAEDISRFLDYLPLNINMELFNKFQLGLSPSVEEKKS
jgi:hypothetical protein